MFLNIKFYFEIFVDLVVVVRNNRDPMYPLAIPPSVVTFYRNITHCGLDIDIDAVKVDNIFLTTRISSGLCPRITIVTLTHHHSFLIILDNCKCVLHFYNFVISGMLH